MPAAPVASSLSWSERNRCMVSSLLSTQAESPSLPIRESARSLQCARTDRPQIAPAEASAATPGRFASPVPLSSILPVASSSHYLRQFLQLLCESLHQFRQLCRQRLLS